MVPGQAVEPDAALARQEPGLRVLDQPTIGPDVTFSSQRFLAERGQPLCRELADDGEHPEAGFVRSGRSIEQVVVDQLAERVEYVPVVVGAGRTDGLDLGEARGAREDRAARQHPLGPLGEQVVAPCDGIGDRSLSGRQIGRRISEQPVPESVEDGGWLDNDPFGSRPADKLALLKDALDWTAYIGFPGPANPATGEVFGSNIIPTMMAKAALGELTAEEAVAEAEVQINEIFDRWRERGLVGCQ